MDILNYSIDWINNNQGVISLVGLFLIIPISIFTDRYLAYRKKKQYEVELKNLLLQELWININFVAQIEKSYENNLINSDGLHIPHYPPRIEIISKFLNFDLITSLKETEKEILIEVYSQLEGLKVEFTNWKEKMIYNNLKDNSELYKKLSLTMLYFIDAVMKNMMNLWIGIVKDLGKKSMHSQIRELNKIILDEIKKGNWIRSSYKASDFKKDMIKDLKKFDIIMCWIDDWQDCPKKIIEISKVVPLHDSWKDNDLV